MTAVARAAQCEPGPITRLGPGHKGEEGGCDSTPATARTMNFVRFVKRKFHILHRGLAEFPTIDWWIIMAVTKTILDLFE